MKKKIFKYVMIIGLLVAFIVYMCKSCGQSSEAEIAPEPTIEETSTNSTNAPQTDTTVETVAIEEPTTPIVEEKEASNNTQWDELLDEYEEFIDDYIACMKKANNGDLSAMSEMAELMKDVQDISGKIEKVSSSLTASQASRYSKLMQKLSNAASNL
ncbi:MAG: hypothetical protein J6J57_00120 [Alistipes sp.]|nr:hypothetical protein [Alistipes sp.]